MQAGRGQGMVSCGREGSMEGSRGGGQQGGGASLVRRESSSGFTRYAATIEPICPPALSPTMLTDVNPFTPHTHTHTHT